MQCKSACQPTPEALQFSRMTIYLQADSGQYEEILEKKIPAGHTIHYSASGPDEKDLQEYDIFFLLHYPADILSTTHFGDKPVVIHSVSQPLTGYPQVKNLARINAWTGFLKRDTWEMASLNQDLFKSIFQEIGWETIFVKDTPGLVAGRVISMIINEAFIALQEGVSTREEIDLAMKLGTNYPYGPFEWASVIGVEQIYDVLQALALQDSRCIPVFTRDGQPI